ncbi:MAG: hypothetical protein EXS00_09140, partial [Phycisphaerales bacterium]|nr:hypothetical protein [Phycisphaerales bacterium]
MNIATSVASILGTVAGAAAAVEATDQEVAQQIAQLRTEVTQLRAQSSEHWLTNQRADEIRKIVQDTIADADTRLSLQVGGATAGYDGGFFLSSADGNWKLRINALEQVRFVYNHGSATAPATPSGTEWGFENRRTQLTFSGSVVDPSWTYIMRFAYDSESSPYDANPGQMVLQDAAIRHACGSSGLSVVVGQFKTPYMRESLMDDGTQLTIERSVVDNIFSSGYQQGIMFDYLCEGADAGCAMRMRASYGNGFREEAAALNPYGQFQNQAWDSGGTSFNIAGRVDWKLSGEWAQFEKETSFKGESCGLLLGAAIGYENDRGANSNPAVIDPYNAIKWTVDATAMFGGANLSAALTGQYAPNDAPTTAPDPGAAVSAVDTGFVVQGGYMLSDQLEVYGRWEYWNLQFANGSYTATTTEHENVLTIGANYYFSKNLAKLSLDVGVPLNANDQPGGPSSFVLDQGAGWLNG